MTVRALIPLFSSISYISITLGLHLNKAGYHTPASLFVFFGANYAFFAGIYLFRRDAGSLVIRKNPETGQISLFSKLLWAPFLGGHWAVFLARHRVWHRRRPAFHRICRNLYLGRFPSNPQTDLPPKTSVVVDLTLEFSEPPSMMNAKTTYLNCPSLDNHIATVDALCDTARLALQLWHQGEVVFVHCANGKGRSGSMVVLLLVLNRTCETIEEAIAFAKARRPQVRVHGLQLGRIKEALSNLESEFKQA